MTVERFDSLEGRLRAVEVQNAALSSTLLHLTQSIDRLAPKVDTLNAAMNQGKGAAWLAMTATGGLGAFVALVLKEFFGR